MGTFVFKIQTATKVLLIKENVRKESEGHQRKMEIDVGLIKTVQRKLGVLVRISAKGLLGKIKDVAIIKIASLT